MRVSRAGRAGALSILSALLMVSQAGPSRGAALNPPTLAPVVSSPGGSAGRTEETERDRRASVKRIGLSLLLPGAAHLQMGENRRAAAFLLTEVASWTAWAVFRVQGSLRQDSFVELAELGAGVPHAGGRSDTYYRLLGNWSSSDAYDQVIRREARDLYPNDLPGRAAYFEAHRTSADRAWRWESQAAWDRYRAKRNDSRHAYRGARMMLGVAAANRVAAMVDASLLTRRHGGGTALRIQAAPGTEPGSVAFSFSLLLP